MEPQADFYAQEHHENKIRPSLQTSHKNGIGKLAKDQEVIHPAVTAVQHGFRTKPLFHLRRCPSGV